MKKLLLRRRSVIKVGLILVMIFVANGCDSKSDKGETKELKLAYIMAPVGAAHEAAQKFADLVKEKTDGRITIKLYPSASLGNDRELAEGLTFGSVHFVLSGLASISWYIPEYEALEAPFAFRSYEHLDNMVNGEIGREVAEALSKATKINILAWWPRGPRYLTTNKEIRTPADLKGMKLRVPKLPTYIEAWRILGTNPTPITYSEMFMALRQKVVEGQENPLEVIYTSSLYEVQKYVIETKHLLGAYIVMTSEKLLNGLSPEEQQTIKEAAVEAGKYEYNLMLKYEKDYIRKLKEKGMTFIELDMKAFREPVVKELPKRFKDKWAPNLFERIQNTE